MKFFPIFAFNFVKNKTKYKEKVILKQNNYDIITTSYI